MRLKRTQQLSVLAALLSAGVSGCGDSAGDLTGPANRAPAPGRYLLTYTGCFACSLNNTPGFVLTFRNGVEAEIEITSASEAAVTIRLISVGEGGGSGLTDAFEEQTWTLDWQQEVIGGPGFLGRTGYGCNSGGCFGLFTQIIRRTGGPTDLECGFGVLYPTAPSGGVTDGRCTIQGL